MKLLEPKATCLHKRTHFRPADGIKTCLDCRQTLTRGGRPPGLASLQMANPFNMGMSADLERKILIAVAILSAVIIGVFILKAVV